MPTPLGTSYIGSFGMGSYDVALLGVTGVLLPALFAAALGCFMFFGRLSGGEQQLPALARCFCGGPSYCFWTSQRGIQPSNIDEIVDTLTMISKTQGATIVLVEQNLEFLVELVSRIVVLQRGQVRDEIGGERIHDIANLAEALM